VIQGHTDKKLKDPTQQGSRDSKDESNNAKIHEIENENRKVVSFKGLLASCKKVAPKSNQRIIILGIIEEIKVNRARRSNEQGDADSQANPHTGSKWSIEVHIQHPAITGEKT
jgi:hypothetical protein